MRNLDSILKSRDITLPTKVCLVKAMLFLVVMYGCEIVKVKVAQLCLTLWDPMDYTVHGILQARILEWVAVPFSRAQTQVYCGQILYHLSRQGSRKTLEWVACPSSSGSSQPRNRAGVPCMAGGSFTS